jgi:hypothetical protein
MRYVSTARGIQISDRTLAEKAEILKDITAPLHTWLFSPRWRFRSRYLAFMELPGILAKYDQEGEPVVEPAKAPTVGAGDPPVKEGPTPKEG